MGDNTSRGKLTKAVWTKWKKREKGNGERQIKQLEKLKYINPPEEFISASELEFMKELNSDYTKKGKYLAQIDCDTSLSYPTILSIAKRLRERGIIIRKQGIKKNGKLKLRVYVLLTPKGLFLLKIWKEIYRILKI